MKTILVYTWRLEIFFCLLSFLIQISLHLKIEVHFLFSAFTELVNWHGLIFLFQLDKCWAGISLLGVTCELCSDDRFVDSYSSWFDKLKKKLQVISCFASAHNSISSFLCFPFWGIKCCSLVCCCFGLYLNLDLSNALNLIYPSYYVHFFFSTHL